MNKIELNATFFRQHMRPLLRELIRAAEERSAAHGDCDFSDALIVIRDEFLAKEYTLAQLVPAYSPEMTLDLAFATAATAAINDLAPQIQHALAYELNEQKKRARRATRK